jgi:flagellar biosynthesis protein FlhF
MVLIGPTGVGKTTTITKLAALNVGSEEQATDIRFINMDNYKIGAEQQLGKYAEIMHRPFISIYNFDKSLDEAINETRQSELVLVDTSGSSPYEIARLADLSTALNKFGKGREVYLTISASTKESDVLEILSMFKILQYKAIILTKLDETKRIGPILGPLIERREAIAYLTMGQVVRVNEIASADIGPIWARLNGFSKHILDKVLRQLDDENDLR